MERSSYQSNRYRPGYWNGLNGGVYYGQYFNKDSDDRVAAMMEVTSALKAHGIFYTVTRWKKYYRVTIGAYSYKTMSERLKNRLLDINIKHMENW